jgi:L-fucose isomerase-like protein
MPGREADKGAEAGPGKPRLGVLLVTSGWFRDVGLQGAGSDTSASVDKAGAEVVRRIGEHAEVLCDGVLYSAPEARTAGRRLREAGVDGVLLAPLMWCEDAIPRAALAEVRGMPLAIWTYAPGPGLPERVPFQLMLRGSGTVCTTQLSGMLRREGTAYRSIAGHAEDPRVYREIGAFARAAATRARLRDARIGMLPFPCDQMSSTWVDELGLRARYGTQVRHLELERVRRLAAACAPAELAAFGQALAATGASIEVDGRNLEEGARYAIALEKLAREEGLSAIAMNDVIPEMHESFGLRPCLSSAALSSRAVVSMEADVGAAFGMLALRLFTGERPFYTEPLAADYATGAMIMGHAGCHDAANADTATRVRIVPDVEYENSDRFTGAATWFKYRPGEVTAVNSVWDGERVRWCCVEGRSLPGPARLEGNAHLAFQPDIALADLWRLAVQIGVSQHWLIVPGRLAAELAMLAAVLGTGFVRLDARAAEEPAP